MTKVEWKKVPLTAVCASADDIKCGPFGTQLNKDEFREDGVPLWGIKQVNVGFAIPTKEFLEPRTAKRLQQYDLKPGDIVMTRKGTVGNCAVYPEHFEVGIMHSDLLRLRVDAVRCEPSFLVHQLHHSPDVERQLVLISGGAIMPGINVGRLKQLEVVLPPLAEQRRIAEVLDRAEALRAKRRAALAELDSLTQSLFLDLFGDPVTNPKGWSVSRVGDVAEVQGGLQVTTARKDLPNEVPYLRVANVYRGFLNLDEIKTIRATETEIARTTLMKDDLLIVEGHGNPDEIGRGALWDGSIAGCIHQNHIIRVRFASEKLVPLYACEHLNSPGGRRHLLRAGKTTTGLNTISVSEVRGTPVTLPPIALQQEFARRVGVVEKLKQAQRAALAEQDALFATLQHRAFRGEL